MQRTQHIRRVSVTKLSALASAVSAVVVMVPQALGGSAGASQDFTIKPIDWVGVNNQLEGNSYGFSNTNYTGQTSPAGEAGGTFNRSSTRGYYADNQLYGSLNQDNALHGEGEFFFGNGATADTDGMIGHQTTSLAPGSDVVGIGIFEDGAPGFRFTYQIYSGGSDIHGARTSFPNGQYFWTYDWDPTAENMTVKLFAAANHVTPIFTESSQTYSPGQTTGATFSVNAYGPGSGFNGSSPPATSYEYFIDAAKYSSNMPKRNEQFNSSPANWQQLGGGPNLGYGYSDSNNTAQESGSGEAGGQFRRDNLRRGYADTNIQFLTQAQPFGATGEFFFGGASNPDNEAFIAHYGVIKGQIKDQVDGTLEGDSTDPTQGGHNMAGLYVMDYDSTNFRMIARIYDSNAVRFSSETPAVVPAGTYKFDYYWDPGTLTLTARILDKDTLAVVATNSVTVPAGTQLDLDAFGLTSGFNGSYNAAQNYNLFIDNVTYAVGQQWSLNANGNWGTSANWDGAMPDGIDQVAYFGSNITAARTVNVEAPKTVGNMFFDSALAYTISGASTITINGSHISALQGSHSVAAPIAFTTNTTINVAGGSTLTTSNLQSTSVILSKTGTGTLAVNNVRATGLSISAGTVLVLPSSLAAGVSKVTTLAITGTGKLDLNNNKLITQDPAGTATGGFYNGVQGLVQSGRNGGAWNGDGIVTSQSAAQGNLTTLGVSTGAIAQFLTGTNTTIWAGQTINASSTMVMYTYTGDANLDGIIDGTDYFFIDSNVGTSATGYGNGDFNYDGIVDGTDYFFIDSNIIVQGVPFFASGELLAGVAAVPEPASLSVIGLGAAALMGRRRRAAR